MRPSEAGALDRAVVVIWVGEGLTPWLHDPLETLASDAAVLGLLEADGTVRHAYRDTDDEAHDDHDDHDDHGHDDRGHDDHGHEGTDPHGWLDPENGRLWLSAIADALSAVDPTNAAAYRANADQGAAEIATAAAEIAEMLAATDRQSYAVFHDGYRYFEERFDVSPAFAIRTGDAVSPGPARLSALRDQAREKGVACVFTEPQFDSRLIATVAEGMEVKTATLDPLGSTLEPGPGLYVALLRDMADAMAGCMAGE